MPFNNKRNSRDDSARRGRNNEESRSRSNDRPKSNFSSSDKRFNKEGRGDDNRSRNTGESFAKNLSAIVLNANHTTATTADLLKIASHTTATTADLLMTASHTIATTADFLMTVVVVQEVVTTNSRKMVLAGTTLHVQILNNVTVGSRKDRSTIATNTAKAETELIFVAEKRLDLMMVKRKPISLIEDLHRRRSRHPDRQLMMVRSV
ncbi:hypothetical protein [Sphingobacterium populi]|uniref:hypothetical protein n=1 Tax=Sphingobacterium sp. CFCC 11742 TaxID=1775560 RepID=UPI000B038A9D|nr:hypothetical protein [Sphingobacterium sp. CFCC 11742]